MLHDTTRYFCPCAELRLGGRGRGSPRTNTFPPHNAHALADLYFCPNCLSIKCTHCCHASVTCKYCPNCMADYTDSPGATRCLKKCFECPACSAPLAVLVHDTTSDRSPAKLFLFACTFCPYAYTTAAVSRPAPLAAIVRAENPSYFSVLHDHYSLLVKRTAAGHVLLRENLHKLRQMGVSAEGGAADLDRFEPRELDLTAAQVCAPQGKHLVAKKSVACGACGAVVVAPVADPRLMKILKKELAIEVVPLVTALVAGKASDSEKQPDAACLLHIVNPLTSSINVTVLILESLPATLLGNPSPAVSVSLPVVKAVVGARRERANVLDSVPTAYLTNATAASRAEQLARTIRREGELRKLKAEVDTLAFVEKGTNWVSLPFAVALSAEAAGDTWQIPFHIAVETKMPLQWSARRAGEGLRFSFWAVCKIERVHEE